MLRKTGKSEEIIEKYKRALSYIESFLNTSVAKGEKGSPDIFIKRTRALLAALGNPHEDLRFVHVAGTAGKGTASTFIHSMLVKDGKRAGLFTSPYVTTAIEMIKVGEFYISPEDLVEMVEILKPKIEAAEDYGKPTASEMLFIIAVLYFKKEKCEWAVIEAGIGGRYDATNVIESPAAAVITNIDLDHTKILGKTLEEIAKDKAGIIKRGSLFFTCEKRKNILDIFKDICELEEAICTTVEPLRDAREAGRALAAAVCEGLGISKKAIASVKDIALPCRFERMSSFPLVILDGAHSGIKMRSVRENLKSIGYKKLHLVFGMGSIGPDSERMLPEIIPLADSIAIAGSGDLKRKLANPEAIAPLIEPYLKKGVVPEVFDDPHAALERALLGAGKGDCVLATGSFFLVGELRKKGVSEEYILEHRKSFK